MADNEAAEGSEKVAKGSEGDISNGPVQKRVPRDILWCVLYILHVLAFFYLGFTAFMSGDPIRMVNGRDFMGNVCGAQMTNAYGADMSEFPYVYYTINMTTVQYKMADTMGFNAGGAAGNLADQASKMKDDPAAAMMEMVGPPDSLISKLSTYFHPVCVKSCQTELDTDGLELTPRSPMWEGQPLCQGTNGDGQKQPHGCWEETFVTGWQLAAKAAWTAKAYDRKHCPYPSKFCAPMSTMAEVNIATLQSYCVPTIDSGLDMASAAGGVEGMIPSNFTANAEGSFNDALADVVIAWWTFILMGVLSLIIGIVYLVLMRMVIKILVWTSLFLVAVILAGGALLVYLKTQQCAGASFTDTAISMGEGVLNATVDAASDALAGNLTNSSADNAAALFDQQCPEAGYAIPSEVQRYAMQGFSIIMGCILALYIVCICCNMKRIKLAIALNQVAAKFVGQQPATLLIPPLQIVTVFLYLAIWMVLTMYIVSYVPPGTDPEMDFTYREAYGISTGLAGSLAGTNQAGQCAYTTGPDPYLVVTDDVCAADGVSDCFSQTSWSDPAEDGTITPNFKCLVSAWVLDLRFWFALFSILWVNAFTIALGQCTIAGAVGAWYFLPNDQKSSLGLKGGTVWKGLWNSLVYHLGSLALGSFIIACIQLVKYYLMYLAKQADKQHNDVMKYVFKCLGYIVYCVEKCMKFLNKNAYIQIALRGKKFCAAAKDAFFLIFRNALRIAAAGLIAPVIHFFGFIFIFFATIFLGYMIVTNVFKDELSSPFGICFFYAIEGYVCGKLVMNVFGLAVDTTLQCFVADEEINGTVGPYTPPELTQFLSENKDALDDVKGKDGGEGASK